MSICLLEISAINSRELFFFQYRFAASEYSSKTSHFLGFGNSLLKLNFLDSKSWDEIVEMVAKAAEDLPEGTWIEGRGWHQEKWISGTVCL